MVLSPAQYYNYTRPRGSFIPTSLNQSELSWWSRDASTGRLVGTFRLASGVAATCLLKSAFNSSFDADRLRAINSSSSEQFLLLAQYYQPGCESVFVNGLPLSNFVPPSATVIVKDNNQSQHTAG